jgi:hypothetical protein
MAENRAVAPVGKGKATDQKNIKDSLKQLEKVGGRAGADTLRLWDSYREQAYMWRALALLQMPATALSIAAALIMFFFADTIIEVPERPQPGYYSVKQLPDSQFIGTSVEIINHIATYQPKSARSQFRNVKKWLWEPALTEFEESMWNSELKTIEETLRSQLFIVNEKFVRVERFPDKDYVVVKVPGLRYRLIGDKPLPAEAIMYFIRMTTIPRNVYNEYGIVATDVRFDKLQEGQQF